MLDDVVVISAEDLQYRRRKLSELLRLFWQARPGVIKTSNAVSHATSILSSIEECFMETETWIEAVPELSRYYGVFGDMLSKARDRLHPQSKNK